SSLPLSKFRTSSGELSLFLNGFFLLGHIVLLFGAVIYRPKTVISGRRKCPDLSGGLMLATTGHTADSRSSSRTVPKRPKNENGRAARRQDHLASTTNYSSSPAASEKKLSFTKCCT